MGVSHTAVRNAINVGRINFVIDSNGKRLIDAKEAKIYWVQNRDESKVRNKKQKLINNTHSQTEIVLKNSIQDNVEAKNPIRVGHDIDLSQEEKIPEEILKKNDTSNTRSITESKKIREHYAAEKEKLELKKILESVVDKEVVIRGMRDVAFNYKRTFEKIPESLIEDIAEFLKDDVDIQGVEEVIRKRTYKEYNDMREGQRQCIKQKKKEYGYSYEWLIE